MRLYNGNCLIKTDYNPDEINLIESNKHAPSIRTDNSVIYQDRKLF